MKYIITGCSSGLGYCLSERLLKYGDVIGISRNLHGNLTSIGNNNFKHIKYDFSLKFKSVFHENLINELMDFVKKSDFTLVLNAAAFYLNQERLNETKRAALFELNLFSIFHLVSSLECFSLRRVFIVNSIAGIRGQEYQHEYSASKHALMGFARSLSKTAKSSNFDVMSINPGGMKTPLWDGYDNIDTSDFLDPASVADVCIPLITFPQRMFVDQLPLLPPSDL